MKGLRDRVQALAPEVIAIRRQLHENPELSEQEFETGKTIASYLEKWGVAYQTGIANTGLVATIRGNGPGKVVGLRADIDALAVTEQTGLAFASKHPGVAHCCGHDGHTAIALGAAKLFQDLRDQFCGTVKVFFQPAEETVGGAKRMIDAGCLENPRVDAVLGLHMSPKYPVGHIGMKYGKMMAASDEFTVVLSGRSCHGAHPELGCDAIAMAGQVICALQTIVSRNLAPVNAAVVTVGKMEGGSAGNVLADRVELTGIMRCLDLPTRAFLHQRVREVVEGTAAAFGGRGELILRPSYSPLINDDGVVETMRTVAAEVLGPDHVHMEEYPDLGTEDFSFFALERPSCFYRLGSGVGPDLHNAGFLLDEDCLALGVELQVRGALALLAHSTEE